MPLHIGTLPGRKSVCLYKIDGNTIVALAYFRNEGAAREAMLAIDDIARMTPTKEWHGWRIP